MYWINKDAAGFLGTACKAARYAYERNVWAEHWYGKMREAATPEEFWHCSVLFAKVVDGRFDVWGSSDSLQGEAFGLFRPTLKDAMKSRLKKWKQLREKKLWGRDTLARASAPKLSTGKGVRCFEGGKAVPVRRSVARRGLIRHKNL